MLVMGVQVLVVGLYFAPVPSGFPAASEPPQTMNSLPDQTHVAPYRGAGALVLATVFQIPVRVLYSLPFDSGWKRELMPPQMKRFVASQPEAKKSRGDGALVVEIAVQVLVRGS